MRTSPHITSPILTSHSVCPPLTVVCRLIPVTHFRGSPHLPAIS